MKPVRVLIIEDSAFMRKMISNILRKDPQIQVIGTARNGEEGINKIKELAPDVVTLDINMPILDGIQTLKIIMENFPLPVLMLSSEVGEGKDITIKAMEYGAIDFIMKPSGEISLDINSIEDKIISKVIAASTAMLRPDCLSTNRNLNCLLTTKPNLPKAKSIKEIIAIGASTGGPRAIQQVLNDLPADFITPILIVQHMPSGFTNSFAKRLNELTPLHVKEATHGELIEQATVYIAPGDYHMKVERVGMSFAIKLSQEQPYSGHRPAVDVLFNSMAQLRYIKKIATVLTGMGTDGSKGIHSLKQADNRAVIIAESEQTAVIYGMPKSAIKTKLVDHVLPLHKIGGYLGSNI